MKPTSRSRFRLVVDGARLATHRLVFWLRRVVEVVVGVSPERRCEVGVVIGERHDAVEEVTDESTVEVVEKSSRSSRPRLVTSQDE